MSFSINEIEGLGQRAARGAGAHPAQAAHFGRACARHLAAKRDPAALAALLCDLAQLQILPVAPPQTPLGTSYREAMAAPDAAPPKPTRVDCPDDLYAAMQELAQKIYVPATAESRSGAGAGLTDND